MNYKIIWKTKELKQAKALPADDRTKVSRAVGQLEQRENWKQVKQLTNPSMIIACGLDDTGYCLTAKKK